MRLSRRFGSSRRSDRIISASVAKPAVGFSRRRRRDSHSRPGPIADCRKGECRWAVERCQPRWPKRSAILGSNGTRHMSTTLIIIEACENVPAALGPDLVSAVDLAQAEKAVSTRKAYGTDFRLFRSELTGRLHEKSRSPSKGSVGFAKRFR
jgi:hypothetical protein